MRSTRCVVLLAILATVSLSGLGHLRAETYPSRAITLIAPWPPGGAIDALCRTLGPKLADRLGQPVVVENKPGAGSTLGVAAGARAAPDGYTLVMAGSASFAISPTMYKKLPYDPINDFSPVALVAGVPFVLVVGNALPIHSVADLVKYAKDKPGQLDYGSGGPGSPHHLSAELFKTMTGIEIKHVPYKGSLPALTDVMAGHIQLLFSDNSALPQIKAGNVRALGVTSSTRWTTAPEIPTIAEAGVPGFEAVGWGMLAAPAGTPRDAVARLQAEFKAIAETKDYQDKIIQLGLLPIANPAPDQLQPYIAKEIERWGKVVRQAGLEGTQ